MVSFISSSFVFYFDFFFMFLWFALSISWKCFAWMDLNMLCRVPSNPNPYEFSWLSKAFNLKFDIESNRMWTIFSLYSCRFDKNFIPYCYMSSWHIIAGLCYNERYIRFSMSFIAIIFQIYSSSYLLKFFFFFYFLFIHLAFAANVFIGFLLRLTWFNVHNVVIRNTYTCPEFVSWR